MKGLIGLVSERNGRVILHGVRHSLLERQADAVGLPLRLVPLDWTAPVSEHNAALRRSFSELGAEGAECVAFGNLLSPGLMERGLRATAGTGVEPVFPLLQSGARDLCKSLLKADVSAWVCSVDTGQLPADRAGRRLDAEFLAALPDGIDPGSERDYHTFVEWAPGWSRRVTVRPTRSIAVYDFAFADLEPDTLPGDAAGAGADTATATRPAEPQAARTSSSGPGANRHALADAMERAFDPFSYFARLERVRRHVDNHLAGDLDIAAIARVAAMSPTGFSRYFRQHVGMTFAAWLARHRVEHACRKLRENNLAVSRIAEAAGFHSERTFRRVFHEHMACSPAQYRKRWLAQRQPPMD